MFLHVFWDFLCRFFKAIYRISLSKNLPANRKRDFLSDESANGILRTSVATPSIKIMKRTRKWCPPKDGRFLDASRNAYTRVCVICFEMICILGVATLSMHGSRSPRTPLVASSGTGLESRGSPLLNWLSAHGNCPPPFPLRWRHGRQTLGQLHFTPDNCGSPWGLAKAGWPLAQVQASSNARQVQLQLFFTNAGQFQLIRNWNTIAIELNREHV